LASVAKSDPLKTLSGCHIRQLDQPPQPTGTRAGHYEPQLGLFEPRLPIEEWDPEKERDKERTRAEAQRLKDGASKSTEKVGIDQIPGYPDAKSLNRTYLVRRLAKEIMRIGDRHTANQELSITEMRTYLKGSKHHDFLEWLLKIDSGGGKIDTKKFSQYDADSEGSLDIDELTSAVNQYVIDKIGVEKIVVERSTGIADLIHGGIRLVEISTEKSHIKGKLPPGDLVVTVTSDVATVECSVTKSLGSVYRLSQPLVLPTRGGSLWVRVYRGTINGVVAAEGSVDASPSIRTGDQSAIKLSLELPSHGLGAEGKVADRLSSLAPGASLFRRIFRPPAASKPAVCTLDCAYTAVGTPAYPGIFGEALDEGQVLVRLIIPEVNIFRPGLGPGEMWYEGIEVIH